MLWPPSTCLVSSSDIVTSQLQIPSFTNVITGLSPGQRSQETNPITKKLNSSAIDENFIFISGIGLYRRIKLNPQTGKARGVLSSSKLLMC